MSATAKAGRPIPGPRGKPVIGSLPEFRKSMVQALMDGWREYGDVVRYRGPISLISIAHPDFRDELERQARELSLIPKGCF